MITRPKKILFALVPVLLLFLLLALVESSLRIFNPSLASPIVQSVQSDGVEAYMINRGALTRYFSSDNIIIPELKPSIFVKHKNPKVFRIMCLGESSMFGTPYQMNANIPSILRKQLRHEFPEVEFEVLNLGAAAVNSNVILELADRLVGFEPDLIIAYMGHNEFYGPDGVGASFIERTFPSLIPLKYDLRGLRIVAWFQRMMRSYAASAQPGERNLMKEVSQNDKVELNSPDARWVFGQFRANLTALARLCKSRRIPLIISDVTSNLMFPPFSSDSILLPAVGGKNLADAESAFSAQQYVETKLTLSSLLTANPTNAIVNYWMGRTYLALGQPDSAKLFLGRARDYDLLKFRAPAETDSIIRSVCADEGVPLVSSDSLFSKLSAGGIAGRELFWEHLHPTALGYYEIAGLYFQKVLELLLVPHSGPDVRPVQPLPFQTDSLSICWVDLAFGDIAMRNLTKHWPFSNYESHAYVIENEDTALQNIAYDLYASKIPWSEACLRSALYFQQHGRLREAATTYEGLLEEYPTNYYSHYLLGFVYKEMGQLENAVSHLSASIKYNPQYPYPRIDLGLLQINEGRIDEAIENFTAALQLTQGRGYTNETATIDYGLSAAYANKGNYSMAKKYVDASLALSPAYRPAQILRERLLQYK